MKNVAFFGLGYVGLVTAATVASRGYNVFCYDVDRGKIDALRKGKVPIFEPGLEELIKKTRVTFTDSPAEAVEKSDLIFITVGTPSMPDGSIVLRYVKAASEEIGRHMNAYKVIAVKSTVVPGTLNGVVKPALESNGKRCCVDFGLVSNPEFLREGRAIEDTLKPDRVVIGQADSRSGDTLESFWRDIAGQYEPPVLRTTPENAEMIKYANNSFLAMKVTFANMFARLCQRIPGADVDVVMKGIGLDRRIGKEFLYAGMAWGGSCFPKDLKAIACYAKSKGTELGLVEEALSINNRGPADIAGMAGQLIGGIKGKTVSIIGITFKPDTDDTRESPAFALAYELKSRGAEIKCCDPKASSYPEGCSFFRNYKDCLKGSDLAILVTEWEEYKKLGPEDFKLMRNPALIDTRRVYSRELFEQNGVKLLQLGIGQAKTL
ncbi:MAG: UDP-glucose/GDP-mannose dehydrogenase family protein [Nitrososphaerota archaeon]|jgi:UDPglucose 6-dehydrogenase|nr:UDP-glucose/GDP-mannose dehydrogenase family protein [Nitrososphaerota archaeon]MDG6931130.1 UDP-glucose/GDP-mannose dehydrogenase family protein [Nitrososphaerota archaeon]